MEEQTLKEKTAKGLLWGGIHNGIMQLLNLVFGIFLARLLTPSDYGMIGMLLVFSSVAGILQESGFTTALINRKEFRHEDYNAVFWFSTLTGATLYIILFLCAPLIARFYHQPELTSLARYMFLSFVISSMGIAHNALLIKQMKIRQNAIIGITSLFISGIVGITMAYNGMAYWGIATQTLTYVFFIVVGRWHFSGWRPTFSFNFKPLREMIGFSMKILASNLITQINNNILTVILGRFYDSHQVGFYNQANKWKDMGSYTVQGMTNSVSQPVIRQVEEESERLIRIFRKMLRFAAFISMPCMFGLALTAPEIITIAITDKWLESARLMQILCIGAAFMPIQTLMYNMIISKERSDICLWNTIVFGITQIVVELFCYPYGITTMVWAFTAMNIAWLTVWWYYVWKLTGLSGWLVLKDVLPFVVIAGGSILAAGYAASFTPNIYWSLMVKIAVAVVLYASVMYLSGANIFRESVAQITGMIRKKHE